MSDRRIDRRRALLLGAGAVGLSAIGASAAAGELDRMPGDPTVPADVGAFDLGTPATRHIREKLLHNSTVMQSFAVDHKHKHLYAVQLMQGGIKLRGESAAVSGTARREHGDLCLTRLDLAGKKLGHMYLRGFGHGASLGVEVSGSRTYIWTEADASRKSGYGRGVARVEFADGKVLDSDSDAVHVHHPVKGATGLRPSVDPFDGTLLVHYFDGDGKRRYRLMKLSDVVKGDYTAVHDVAVAGVSGKDVLQGICVFGDYAYAMTGTAYTSESGNNPPSKRGNTYLSSVHLPTGKLHQRKWTQAAYSLDYREPEGLAVWPRSDGKHRLCLGFASGKPGGRRFTVYYKSQ